jgi:hypothetical protein
MTTNQVLPSQGTSGVLPSTAYPRFLAPTADLDTATGGTEIATNSFLDGQT